MKTTLPESIKTVEEAKNFLTELVKNSEEYHPDDSAQSIAWILPEEQKPTAEECDKLNELMEQVRNIEGFDCYQFVMDKHAEIHENSIFKIMGDTVKTFLFHHKHSSAVITLSADDEIDAWEQLEFIAKEPFGASWRIEEVEED